MSTHHSLTKKGTADSNLDDGPTNSAFTSELTDEPCEEQKGQNVGIRTQICFAILSVAGSGFMQCRENMGRGRP